MIQIVYDHHDFLVINKPCGVSFHSEDGAGLQVKIEKQIGYKLHAIHRLDKGTSGIIVFAKNSDCARKLSHLWQSKLVQKYYLALSDFSPKKKQGTIKGDMQKSRRGSYKLTRNMQNPAVTQFVTVSVRSGVRLYLCRPITGKTHQIRVALKSNGTPILGDTRYGGSPSDRLYLHSYVLHFEYNDQNFYFKCLPELGREFQLNEFFSAVDHFMQPDNIIWPKV